MMKSMYSKKDILCLTFKLGQTTTASCFRTISASKILSIHVPTIMVVAITIAMFIVVIMVVVIMMQT